MYAVKVAIGQLPLRPSAAGSGTEYLAESLACWPFRSGNRQCFVGQAAVAMARTYARTPAK
jgi:hypothetical protein